ncbi:hypothetical protein [Streptomyces sp. NPDC003032]
MSKGNRQLAAGLELGTYERKRVERLAGWEWATIAVIASWAVRAATAREPALTVALPSRFDATLTEVDRHLRRILAEDTYLRYQQAIGGAAVREAAQDIADDSWSLRMRRASELIDPAENGGPYPSQLQCSQHNGFGPCPTAPPTGPQRIPDDRPDPERLAA